MVTDTIEPLASVTVVVTEPSALVALEVVSADEDEAADAWGDAAALGALAGCGALTAVGMLAAAGTLAMEPMVISLPLSLIEANLAPTDEAVVNTATPGLPAGPQARGRRLLQLLRSHTDDKAWKASF